MKAIILARVSTKEQEEGHSIEAQKQRLTEYCSRKGLQVIKTFQIIESSTRGERKEFNGILEYARKQKEVIALVADAVDRIQRSFKESVLLDELIRKERLELHFYREGMIIGKSASSSDIMRWDFSVMGAKSYVLQLSENVKRSLEYKRRNGEWSGPAPIGYLNARDSAGKSIIVLDEARAFLVRRLFEEYSTGRCSFGDLTEKSREWGLTNNRPGNANLSTSHIHKLIQNPFYYGEMSIKGKLYPHKYDTLIDRMMFDRCQAVRLGYNKQPFAYSDKPFVFRGLLKCAVSGRTVTSDTKKGKYVYLICRDPENPEKKLFIKEDVVLHEIRKAFQSIQIPDEILAAITDHLKQSFDAEKKFYRDAKRDLETESGKITDKLDTLLDMLLEKKISQDIYDRKSHDLVSRRDEIDYQLKNHNEADSQFRLTLSTLFSIAARAYDLFESSKIEQKRMLIGFIFSNLELRGAKLCYSLRKPFDMFVKPVTRSEWLGVVDAFRTNMDLRLLVTNLANQVPALALMGR